MNLALLVLRLVVGLTFMAHGLQKLVGAFDGPGIKGFAGVLEQLGLRPGKVHAGAVAITETVGGLLIALGLVTTPAAAALVAVMTGAVAMVHLKNGFFATNQGYEFNLALVAALFALAGIGAGAWSLDNAAGIDLAGTWWAVGAAAAGFLGGLGAIAAGRLYGSWSDRRHRRPPRYAHPTRS
jgi:putative oxidoreductase